MKHNATFFITAFSLLCASNIIYGMEKDDNLNIYCEEDVTIVLHFSHKDYDKGSLKPRNYSKHNPTEMTYNPVNSSTKITSVSFNDHMKNIKEIFEKYSKTEIAYKVSCYLFASHCKHISRRDEYSIAEPTENYFNHAKDRITQFYNQKINFYKFFYKPSNINNEHSDIQLIKNRDTTKATIGGKAIINLPFHDLHLKLPHDMNQSIRFKKMPSTSIAKDGALIMDMQPHDESIILMDV